MNSEVKVMNEEIKKDILKVNALKEEMLELNQHYETQLKKRKLKPLKNKKPNRKKYSEIPLKYFWDLLNLFRLK